MISIIGFDWIMYLTVFLTIFVKAFADAQQRKAALTHIDKKKLKHYRWEKLFKIFMIGIPALGMSQVPVLDLYQVGIFVLSFSLIYFCWIDRWFNWLTGQNVQYIGKTSLIDILLREIFNISDDSPKNKNLLVWLKWLSFIIGSILMLDFTF